MGESNSTAACRRTLTLLHVLAPVKQTNISSVQDLCLWGSWLCLETLQSLWSLTNPHLFCSSETCLSTVKHCCPGTGSCNTSTIRTRNLIPAVEAARANSKIPSRRGRTGFGHTKDRVRTARLVENLFPLSKVRNGLGDTPGKSGLALLLLQEKAKGCVFHKKAAPTLGAGCHLHHLPTCSPPLRPGERTSESTCSGGLVSAAALGNLPFQAIPTALRWPRANPLVISDLCRASKSQRKK